MEEQYELITKEHLKNYKNEIARLKKENEELKQKNKNKNKNLPQTQNSQSVEPKINLTQITQELKKDYEIQKNEIIKELEEIKLLNKKTLDNILSQNEEITDKFEKLLHTLQNLTSSFRDLIENIPQTEQNNVELQITLDEIKRKLRQQTPIIENEQIEKIPESSNQEIMEKLIELENFMKNLKILLSYVKPNDLKLDN